jgi:riboflavin kinase/FMN adenylyltransferase
LCFVSIDAWRIGETGKSVSGSGKLMDTKFLTYPIEEQRSKGAQNIVLAIGYFDGVHLGHQAVIKEAIVLAKELDAVPAVMTFHPHPREVLGQVSINRYLTPLPDKLEQFAKLGVQRTYVIKFDLDFASLNKEDFVEEVLIPLAVKGIVTGFNFTFGRCAAGKASDLPLLGQGRFETRIVEPILFGEIAVSSTRLRQALAAGNVEAAGRILGRPYEIKGEVVTGDQRGRLMGFPTANLNLLEPYIVPKRGVYIVRASVGDEKSYGIMNIGVRPTFSDPVSRERLEVHLLGKNVQLYGQILKVEFLSFIREEKKFPSVDELIKQIQSDREYAENWLKEFVE